MKELKKFASIDIGSNAMRLLVNNVELEDGHVIKRSKNSLLRLPVRLGSDAFVRGEISEKKKARLLDAMNAYASIMRVHEVVDFRAVATSALREATNGAELVQAIKEQTGIEIEVIDGKEEANLIFKNELGPFFKKSQNYLYIDVGGGSTEITLLKGGEIVDSHSFDIGTIRIQRDMVSKESWDELKSWIKEHTSEGEWEAIGSGGNINTIYKISRKKPGKPIKMEFLKKLEKKLKKMSLEERIFDFGLKPDRADVILPAIKIYKTTFKAAGIDVIHVPKIGVSDGVLIHMLEQYEQQQS